MPKENLRITRKSDKELGAIETYGFDKVTEWTKKELIELQKKSKLPICVSLQNGDYIVATYKVVKVSNICYVVDNLEFTDKRSAIFYCSLMHLSKKADALELHRVDSTVSRYDYDKALFRIRLDAAHEANDTFKIDFYSSRFEEAKSNLRLAKQKLEEIIFKAKYFMSSISTGK